MIQGVLRVKTEDLRLYSYSSDDPVLLEDESSSLDQLGLKDGDKLLVESEWCCMHISTLTPLTYHIRTPLQHTPITPSQQLATAYAHLIYICHIFP